MSFMKKPAVRHPKLPVNDLGLTTRDYEGGMSTLCAGCGHDSITGALVEAAWGYPSEELPPLRQCVCRPGADVCLNGEGA